jgi:peroxiredoxin
MDAPMERPLLQAILDSQAPTSVKETVQNVIDQMNRVGQPLELKGAAADGREIDVQQMKGNVVLIDFWATWCGSCLREAPRMKSLYEKCHERGFEIIGVSLDEKLETLKTFLEKNPTSWPQHWIKSWDVFGINSIPTLWLVDKKGIVRDVNARKDMEQKVERLLAEP